jgi:hypothetical protein
MATSLTVHSDAPSVRAEAKRLSAEVDELLSLLRDQERAKAEAAYTAEQRALRRVFFLVSGWLVGLTLALVTALAGLVAGVWSPAQPVLGTVVVATAAGALGSAVSALLSALQRRANGWETRAGLRYPFDEGKSERFNLGIAPFLAARPALGASVGLIVLVGAQAGVFSVAATAGTLDRAAFWSFLAGLFAKTLIEKLKTTFDQLVGK